MNYLPSFNPLSGIGENIAQLNTHTEERITQILTGVNSSLGACRGLLSTADEDVSARIAQLLTGIQEILVTTLPPLPESEVAAGDLMGRVRPQVLDPLRSLFREVLTEVPSNLVDGAEIALYKKVKPVLLSAFTALLRACDEDDERFFGRARNDFAEISAQLENCNAQDVQELRAAIFSGLNALKEHKVHFFGETLNGGGNIDPELSFTKLSMKPQRVPSNLPLAGRVTPPVPQVSPEQKEAFKEQRDNLVRNLKRIALVEVVYQFVIGKSTNHLKEIFSRGNSVEFEEAFFNSVEVDIADYSFFYRILTRVGSYALYKLASFIIDPCIKQAGYVGYDALSEAIDGLNKPEKANALHDHIFESLKNYLDDLQQGYAVVSANRLQEGARGISIHDKVLKFFENSKEIHLGRSKGDFYGEVIDHIVKHLPLLYPIRSAIGYALKRGELIERLFAKVETMKKDKEAFSFAVDKAFANILIHLEEKLREDGDDDDDDVGEVSKLKREQIHSFFEALFDAIPLTQLPTGRALALHIQLDSQAKETYDSTVRDKLLSPAAKGAADSFAFAIKGALTPELVQTTMNIFLQVLNDSYRGEQQITEEERKQARDSLTGVQSRLLDLSIQKGMEGIPLLYPQQEIEIANNFISAIRGETEGFIAALQTARESEDYRDLNDHWNAYVRSLERLEKKISREKRLGDSIKKELQLNYLSPLAAHMQRCNRSEAGGILTLNSQEGIGALAELQDSLAFSLNRMVHMLCYDFVGEGVAGMGRDSAKKIVKQILEKKADGLFSLALHPSMVSYGVGNYLLLRPYLLSEGVKDLSPG